MKKWPKRLDKIEPYRTRYLTKRDSTLKVRERIIVSYNDMNEKQIEMSFYDDDGNLIDGVRIMAYFLDNEDIIEIVKKDAYLVNPDETILSPTKYENLDTELKTLLDHKITINEDAMTYYVKMLRGEL